VEVFVVFFHDILIYNKTWGDHLRNLDEVLGIFEEKEFYEKYLMCKIGVTDMLYFVHIIGESEVWGY